MIGVRAAFEVVVMGSVVTRDGLCRNAAVVEHTVNVVGSRIGVPALHLHIQSFYDFIHVPIDGSSACGVTRRLLHLRCGGSHAGLVFEEMSLGLQ